MMDTPNRLRCDDEEIAQPKSVRRVRMLQYEASASLSPITEISKYMGDARVSGDSAKDDNTPKRSRLEFEEDGKCYT